MLTLKQLLYFSSLLFFAACSSTKNTAVKTVFPFQYEDKEYAITSIVLPEGDGVNMMTHHEDDHLVFRARDYNMDGQMDFVMNGDVSLDKVNIIYQYGIQEAIRQDKFRTMKSLRKYELDTNGKKLTVRTYGFLNDEVYNEFTISDKRGNALAILLDINADGRINDSKFGEYPLEEAQKLYTLVLESGLDKNQITTANEKLIVKKSKP